MKKAYSSGGIVTKIINGKTHILLIKHEDGFLVFPKGHIKDGETEEQAALREVKEETGLSDLKIINKLGEAIRPSKEDSGEEVEKIIHLFLMETDNHVHSEADEDYSWFTYEEALKGLGFPQEKDFLIKVWQKMLQ